MGEGVGYSEEKEKVRGKWIDGEVGWNLVEEMVVAGWVEDRERRGMDRGVGQGGRERERCEKW